MKFHERTHPLDVEYLRRHGCPPWEEEDAKLGEERMKKVEKDLGIEIGNTDFMEIEDPFVLGLAIADGCDEK